MATAEILLELNEAGKEKKLAEVIDNSEINQLLQLIDDKATCGASDTVGLIKAILEGSSSVKSDGVKRRLAIFKHCISSTLQNADLSSKASSDLVGLLMVETDAFPPKCLAIMANLYVDVIKHGVSGNAKSLELFPKILSALDSAEVVEYKENTMKGSEFKSHILNSMCAGRWSPDSVTHITSMFKDVPLTQEELKFVLSKVLRMFGEVDLEELPPLVYQILLLSAKGQKEVVLEGVSRFFTEKDAQQKGQLQDQSEIELSQSSTGTEQLRHVEGTVILHISFAIKQDQELGREFLKFLKAGDAGKMLAPFNTALAMSMARIHRFEEQIFEFLKVSVLKSYKDSRRQEDSQWIREIAPDSCDVAQYFLDTVYHSTFGWDHVTQGLVQLGFTLMDAFGPKAVFGKPVLPDPGAPHTPVHKACALGASVLLNTFKAHKMVRSEILEQILNRVVTKTTVSVSHYLDLLSDVVKSAPQLLLDSLAKVREALDYLSYLPPDTADGLLQAIQPLMKISITLRDALILVLRKAIFSRQVEARGIAVKGFLMILKHFKVLGGIASSQSSQSFSISASQVHVDVHMAYNPSSNEALCLEILGNLRRCLTQQADVRSTLYQGLYDVLCKNTQLANPILSILYAQWKRYYEKAEDVQPPVKLEPCVMSQGEETVATEPLGHLLTGLVQCLFQVTRLAEQQEEGGGVEEGGDEAEAALRAEVEEMLDSFTSRMLKADPEDFELDKSADFSMATSVGVKNNIYALLVSGIYEILLEYTFTTGDYEVQSCEDVIQLYLKLQRLQDLLKEKNSGGGSSKSKSSTAARGRSLLSLRFTTLILKALFSDSVPAHQGALDVLRQNLDLTKYLVTAAIQRLQQVSERGQCEGPEGQNRDKLYKYCTALGRVFLKHYQEDLQTSSDQKRERGKTIALLCLDGFSLSVHIIYTRYRDKLSQFLLSLDPNRDAAANSSEQTQIHAQVKRFQRLVMTVLEGCEEDRSLKEAVSLLNVIGELSKGLQSEGEEFTEVQAWLLRLCTEQQIDDCHTVQTLLSLLFQLTVQQKSCAPVILAIGRDIHSQLGDIDQDVELEDKTNFSLINHKTACPTVLSLLLSQIDRELDDTEWVVARMRSQLATLDTETLGATQREDWDKCVSTKCGSLINCLHELVQSAVPLGACQEGLVKVVTRMYGLLTALAKMYLSAFQQKQGYMSMRFEKLVKHSAMKLTQYVYSMITYIQTVQNESLQQAAEKLSGKKGKDKKKPDTTAVVGKARVLKETRFIPSLIFAIEQYERYLIQLSKKSKVNLMDHFKMSTSRDFRIQVDVLKEALEAQEVSSASGSGSEVESDTNVSNAGEDDQENQEPPRKVKKTMVKEKTVKKTVKKKKLSEAY